MAGYYGQALMNIGSIIGSNMTRSIQEDERQADRLELQREREREATERQRERIAAQERSDALYRRTADQQAAGRTGGGGGDGGLSAKDIGEGGADEGLVARRAGMTVPELRAMRKYSETGDSTPFQRDVTRTTSPASAGVDPYNMETVQETVKELPPGFEREARAKLQTLAKIEESYRFGKNYEGVGKGRSEQQGVDFANAAASDPKQAPALGQAIRVREGKELVDVKDNTAFNVSTGANRPTGVGQSMIGENNAQAGKARAEGKAASDGTSKVDIQGVAANAANLIKLADAAAADGDNVTAKRLRDEAARLSEEAGAKKVPKPAEGKLSEADAHAQAQRALATGKITLDDVNKRLTGAGYKPLSADAGKAGAPKPGPAPAPTTAPAPRDAGLSGMSTRDLRRLAATQGHARQAAAQAELARREADAQTWEEEARANRGMMP